MAKRTTDPGAGYSRLQGTEAARRLKAVRALMRREGLDALIVRSTDAYLSEYVPAAESLRLWLSGFTGSTGDALLMQGEAFLFVDGRYHEQADIETDPKLWTVVKLTLGTTVPEALNQQLRELAASAKDSLKLGFEPERVSVGDLKTLEAALKDSSVELKAMERNLVAEARGPVAGLKRGHLEAVPVAVTGQHAFDKAALVREKLAAQGLHGQLMSSLDEIAYLTNLRAYEIPFNATFRSLAYVGSDALFVFVDPVTVPDAIARELSSNFRFEPEAGWEKRLRDHLSESKRDDLRVAYDPESASVATIQALRRAVGRRGALRENPSPVRAMKAVKNPVELAAVGQAIARADDVVREAIRWVNRLVASGKGPSEADLAEKVDSLFQRAGARSLSFQVIAAAGPNAAIVHYSVPDPHRAIEAGELVLLDTGAYFGEGYATDLTRTFLAGGTRAKATEEQKRIYTLVLKSSIRGMKARFPRGTTGAQLDALVRGPIWEAGHDYAHGTGHGIGILAHEFPPRLSNRSSASLEPGMVFSIEPGIYRPGWGGVRFENLVTVREVKDNPDFLEVVPLSFAPAERSLVDPKLLSQDEKHWLRDYMKGRDGFHSARTK